MGKRSIVGFIGPFVCLVYFIVIIGFILTKEYTLERLRSF